jgi:hypothetical protein
MVVASQHWHETEGFRRGEVFSPSFERYIQCEKIGFFVMFTARDGEKLAGYAGMYITQSMHSQSVISVEDQWFLLPEYRRGRNALAFVKYVEAELAERGVTAIQMSAKISNGIGRILEYLDYSPVSTVFFKSIGRADSAQVPVTAVMEKSNVLSESASRP